MVAPVKVTYLGIRSSHERVWLVERKPIWLPRAYLTRGDLEPARGNLHVCKFLRDLTNIQIRTVTAEQDGFVLSVLPNERVTTQGKKEAPDRVLSMEQIEQFDITNLQTNDLCKIEWFDKELFDHSTVSKQATNVKLNC